MHVTEYGCNLIKLDLQKLSVGLAMALPVAHLVFIFV